MYLDEERLQILSVRGVEGGIEVADVDFDIVGIEDLSVFKGESCQKLYCTIRQLTSHPPWKTHLLPVIDAKNAKVVRMDYTITIVSSQLSYLT